MIRFKFVTDLFMGPDGETWAIGRVQSVPVLFTALIVPVWQLAKHQSVSLSELAVLLPAAAGAATMLITGTNHVDTPGASFTNPRGVSQS